MTNGERIGYLVGFFMGVSALALGGWALVWTAILMSVIWISLTRVLKLK